MAELKSMVEQQDISGLEVCLHKVKEQTNCNCNSRLLTSKGREKVSEQK